MKLLTRNEVIEKWSNGSKYLDYYCCPECRDILKLSGENLVCLNPMCLNENFYNLEEMKEL